MAGIYIHIPFCKKKCHYCDFYKSTNLGPKVQLLYAMMQELEQRADELSGDSIQTIYFGGGTPSVLSSGEISMLLAQISRLYNVQTVAEITMECNPDDINPEYLGQIRETGVNRLSIGIQSFSAADLHLMNRRHSPQQAVDAVKMAQNAGFDNISMDLIYGLPGQDLQAWEENIRKAIDLDVQHISAYHLTYHGGTIFYEKLQTGTLRELPDELSLQQFKMLKEELAKAGFEQYEISNFARNQLYSKHNTGYWFQQKYLGIGPSAHSFDLETRRWNVSDNLKYIDGIEKGTNYFESEQLSRFDRYNDYVITRLRTIWGISEKDIDDEFVPHFRKNIDKYCRTGHILQKNQVWVLSEDGLFISDKIMEDLILLQS
ncbi:MAG: hypothetical protein A2W90_24335 [Bacteroidetes bacterium GWF2_42_66]|nr:MAG: hypothetical protein A2W92_09000 [Bacteroidetes bacterium GWA2_42_15]OFX97944.1 MAG: hypothetical protein A2W89_07765 [Bacteroidetes bacterium GWE2_42_39]OFY45819.1 MAG: hypothetical protein A2W90_24335 [Bacteroidetes bacterium GWF2_42_66]HBL74681.1 coproporphyrinogen III oxidase [Prolixibacteraceae bacterium]HCR89443.1 coproporphyrinogen III oxidase [Prolixibacteraceae bacterium]